MTRLLDYIFYNLEERELDRNQIESYIWYLEELLDQGLPVDKKLAYQNIKRQLLARLNKLNQEQNQLNPKKRKED